MAMCLALLLSACATEKIVYVTKSVVVEPSAALVQNCPVTAPAEKDVFIASTQEARLDWSVKYNIKLLSDMKKCNEQWSTLRKWVDDQKAIYNKPDPK